MLSVLLSNEFLGKNYEMLLFCRRSDFIAVQDISCFFGQYLGRVIHVYSFADPFFAFELRAGLFAFLAGLIDSRFFFFYPSPHLSPLVVQRIYIRRFRYFGDGFFYPALAVPFWSTNKQSFLNTILPRLYPSRPEMWSTVYKSPVSSPLQLRVDPSKLDQLLTHFGLICSSLRISSSGLQISSPFAVFVLSSISERGRRIAESSEIDLTMEVIMKHIAATSCISVLVLFHPRHTSVFRARILDSLAESGISLIQPHSLGIPCYAPAEFIFFALAFFNPQTLSRIVVVQTAALLISMMPSADEKLFFGFGDHLVRKYFEPGRSLMARLAYEQAVSQSLTLLRASVKPRSCVDG